MKVIISPGPTFRWNPFFPLFNGAMESLGNTLEAPRLTRMFDVDVFHINFPEHKVAETKSLPKALITAGGMLCYMLIVRLRGKPVVWTVHDVLPRRGHHRWLSRLYLAGVRQLLSGYIFLSRASHDEFLRHHPDQAHKPALDAFHPYYPSVHLLEDAEKKTVREKLGVKPDEFLVGYLGDLKPYKHPDAMRYIPEKTEDGRDIVLLIAGKTDEDARAYEKDVAQRRHIRIDKRLSDEELEAYIQASDLVFLPYIWAWNSGFLFLVLTCRQKSLTSNLAIFTEMREHFGDKWVTPFDLAATDQHQAVAMALNDASKIALDAEDIDRLTGQMGEMTFARLAAITQSFYQSLR